MTKNRSTWVQAAALLTLLVAILDSTIVTTSAVAITHSLRPVDGAAAVPWLLAAYALSGTIMQPIYGKLADVIGVRRVYLASIGIFVAGSVLCGCATGMTELIVFRALQGLGSGGLLGLTIVVIAQLRPEGESAASNGNGMAAALVGIGLVLGPLVGGLIVRDFGWRWIFFVNVPLGLLVFVIMALCLRLPEPTGRGSLELPSAGLLAVAGAALLTVCQWGGRQVGWDSWQILTIAALGLVAAALFVRRQLRVADPFFPPRLLRQPTLRIITLLQLATGCGMAAGIVYLTLDLQLLHGLTPIRTGLAMIPTGLGLGLGSWAGTLLVRHGRPLRVPIALSALFSALALAGFAICASAAPLTVLTALMVVFGAGLGLGLGTEMLLIIDVVERRDLGVATSGIRFVETLGTSLGATVFAACFQALVPADANLGQVSHALAIVFGIGAAVIALSAVIALRLPGAGSTPSTSSTGDLTAPVLA